MDDRELEELPGARLLGMLDRYMKEEGVFTPNSG